MGVEYRNLLIPRDRSFAPEPDRIARLVERLRAARWVLTPDDPAFEQSDAGSPRLYPHGTGGWAEPFLEQFESPRERWERAQPIPSPVTAQWIAALSKPHGSIPFEHELALHFWVSADEPFADLGMPYPLAYGEDEEGYHDIFIYAARDFVCYPGHTDIRCTCGALLSYAVDPATITPIELESRVRSVCALCAKRFEGHVDGGEDLAFRFAVVVDCGKGWPIARRVGEAPGVAAALERAGYQIDNPPVARPRAPEDDPTSSQFEAQIVRSVYGDPAPPINPALSRMIEEVIGTPFVSEPVFY